MKDITPYLKYYIGRPCLVCYDGRELPGKLHYSHMLSLDACTLAATDIKPIVRRLSSITEEEARELIGLTSGGDIDFIQIDSGIDVVLDFSYTGQVKSREKRLNKFTPEEMDWLIEKGFWLFGDEAFEEGYVIDAATLKNISEKS